MSAPTKPCPLSDRELEVLALLASGKVYKEIAVELTLSASTIRTHLHGIYRKIGAADRAQAVIVATANRWLIWERGFRQASPAPEPTKREATKSPATDELPTDLGEVARAAREVETATRQWAAENLPQRIAGDFTIRVGVLPLPRIGPKTVPTWPLPFLARVNPQATAAERERELEQQEEAEEARLEAELRAMEPDSREEFLQGQRPERVTAVCECGPEAVSDGDGSCFTCTKPLAAAVAA